MKIPLLTKTNLLESAKWNLSPRISQDLIRFKKMHRVLIKCKGIFWYTFLYPETKPKA